jgi:hypothetical protein
MIVLGPLLFLVVVGGLIALGIRTWRQREESGREGGLDLIPYLLMALAVGVAGFSVARLARASLTPDRIAGRPIGELAGALAGLVVAGPTAYLLWQFLARRRKTFLRNPGWPIYLSIVEVVFLTAFFVAVGQFADALTNSALAPRWTDLIVYGGIVAFHWWAESREPATEEVGELPRLVGSAVSVVALTAGAIGTLSWLFSEAYESLGGAVTVPPEPAIPLALTLAAAPMWAWRWLPAWEEESTPFRSLYLSFLTALSLIVTAGAAVTIVAVLLSFLFGQAGPIEDHFGTYPTAVSFALVGGALWIHHRRRIGVARGGAMRGYQYGMTAAGLAGLVGFTVALIDLAFEPRLAGGETGEALILLGCSVIASGLAWLWFWRKVEEAPRAEEIRALQRRMYLLGMAVITGLTAAGSLIASLVVVFRAFLGEGGDISESLRIPLSLTVVSGLAAWHLYTHVRTDGAALRKTEARPFTVTIVCSHPGQISTLFPKEATVRVLYRADDAGVIDQSMAAAIVSEVGGRSSLIWVDGGGFRVAAAREP